jgi:phenylpropionate dioxygenase-like ring-hydroxylating dioxygenase large terminal subunit
MNPASNDVVHAEVRGVPPHAFTSEEVLEAELDAALRPAWHLAGHVSEVREPGAYLTYTLGREELVVTRGPEGDLRAYHNFCTHRGHPLVSGRTGQLARSRFVCQYHGWNFGADGSCRSAPLMPKETDLTRWSLARAHVIDAEGFVFVSFARDEPHEAPDLAAAGLGGYDTRRMRVVERHLWETKANWHIVSENNSECYHCVLNHRDLGDVYDPMDDYLDDEHLPAGLTDVSVARSNVWGKTYEHQSYTYQGSPVCEVPLPRTDRQPAKVRQLGVLPGAFIILSPDSAIMTNWRPISARHTRQEIAWLVHEDATEADVNEELLTKLLMVTQDEDERLCERVQIGVESSAYQPGPLNRNYQAGGINHYMWLAQHMGPDVLA